MPDFTGLSLDDMVDVLNSTKEQLPMGDFTSVNRYPNYHHVNRWFGEGRQEFTGGTEIVKDVQLSENGTARQVKPFDKRDLEATNSLHQIKIPWTYAEAYWVTNRQEMKRNSGKPAFINHIKAKRLDGLKSILDHLEERAVMAPNGPSDDLNPHGLNYWLVPMPSDVVGAGYYGGNPDGFTTKAGINAGNCSADSDNAPQMDGGAWEWRNWTAGGATDDREYYLGNINDAAIRTMDEAYEETHFEPPLDIAEWTRGGSAFMQRIYMGKDTKLDYHEYVRKNNEGAAVTSDAEQINGQYTFRRLPILRDSQLDGHSRSPIQFINHDWFKPFVESGEWLREDPAKNLNHIYKGAIVTFINCTYNFLCKNCREQAIIATGYDART